MRGEEIRESLLDEELTERMIARLQERTGETTSCIQIFLCKMSPAISTLQESSSEALDQMFGNSLAYTRYSWKLKFLIV